MSGLGDDNLIVKLQIPIKFQKSRAVLANVIAVSSTEVSILGAYPVHYSISCLPCKEGHIIPFNAFKPSTDGSAPS